MGLVRGAFFVGLLVLAFSIRHLFIVEHVVADRIVFFDEKAFFRNPQGLLVHFANLGRELDAPRGVVLFVHGYCEHSGYYSDVATFANDANLAAFGLDHVGHGLSQGERGYIQSIDLLADDVLFFASKLQKKYGVPILLYGHSMGGMISIVATQKDTRKLIAGTYLEAPLVKIAAASGKWWQRAAARALRFLPKLKVPGAKLNRELLTRNETLKHRWSQDNVMVRTETFINTGNAFLDGEELIQNWLNAGNISFPFFLATGDEDIACDPQAGVDFFNRARSVNKKLKIYPNHRHNMKFDSDEVEADFVEWAKQIVKGE